jgi:hypothetical protein
MTANIAERVNALKKQPRAWEYYSAGCLPGEQETALELLMKEIHSYDETVLRYLVYHVAARALCMWEGNCPSKWPRITLAKVRAYLTGITPAHGLKEYITPEKPCVNDCRYGEAAMASNAAAYAAAFMLDTNMITATCVAEEACGAFDQVGWAENELLPWFFEVAIPCALEKQFMTGEELSRFTSNQLAKQIMYSLCEGEI